MLNWKEALNAALGPTHLLPPAFMKEVRLSSNSRKLAVQYIERIGGYSRNGAVFPISWNVKVPQVDLGCDALYRLWVQSSPVQNVCRNPGEVGIVYSFFRYVHSRLSSNLFSASLWDEAVGGAYDRWVEDSGSPTDWSARCHVRWGLEGRSGGHLCLAEFENFRLSGTHNADLVRSLMETDPQNNGRYVVRNEEAVPLFLYCAQTSVAIEGRAPERYVRVAAAEAVADRVTHEKVQQLLLIYRASLRKSTVGEIGEKEELYRAILGI